MKKIILVTVLAVGLSGCVARVNPDGSREYRTDNGAFLRVIRIIAEK